MNTGVRITLDDEQRRIFKETYGEPATRINVKVRTACLLYSKLGDENPLPGVLRTLRMSDKARAKLYKKHGMKEKPPVQPTREEMALAKKKAKKAKLKAEVKKAKTPPKKKFALKKKAEPASES